MLSANSAVFDLAASIFHRAYASEHEWDHLLEYEKVVHDVYVILVWFRNDDFRSFFAHQFDAAQFADACDEIGHRCAASTIRLAYRFYQIGNIEACFVMGEALRRMTGAILELLGAYVARHEGKSTSG